MPHPELDENYKPRPWACSECRSVLGVVMRTTDRVRRLWVFARACHAEQVPPEYILRSRPRGMFVVHGCDGADGIQCSRCGALNEWKISNESFQRLMSHYPRKVV